MDLFDVIGYAEKLRRLREDASGGYGKYFLITGPSGSGKTEIGYRLADGWVDGGGAAVYAKSDHTRSRTAFGSLRGWIDYAPRVEFRKEAAELLGRAATELLKVEGYKERVEAEILRRKINSMMLRSGLKLSEQQAALLQELRSMCAERPLLLILDDCHFLDADSIEFVLQLEQWSRADGFAFLKKVNVLFIRTASEDQDPVDVYFTQRIMKRTNQILRTRYCTVQELPAVLHCLGYPGVLPADLIATLHELSRGHLRILAEVAILLGRDGTQISSFLNSRGIDELTEHVMAERLRELGPDRDSVIRSLCLAAVIGDRVARDELCCLANAERGSLDRCLTQASTLALGSLANDTFTFSHDAIRRHFLSTNAGYNAELHTRFAACLQVLRPSDYAGRAFHLQAGGNPIGAQEMLALDCVQRARLGPHLRTEQIETDVLSDPSIRTLVESLIDGYVAYHSGRFHAVARCVEAAPSMAATSPALEAERWYLYSLSLAWTKKASDRRRAQMLIAQHRSVIDQEFEIGARIELLYIYLLVHLGGPDEAKDAEQRLVERIQKSHAHTREGQDVVQVLNRRAESVDVDEIAVLRLQEARQYWRGSGSDGPPRHPLEYYRACNNLCATLCYLGRFAEALDVGIKTIEFAHVFGGEFLQRPEYIVHNYLLASFLSPSLSSRECFREQERLCDLPRVAEDNLIIRNNAAIFAVYSGGIEDALRLLGEAWGEIVAKGDFEGFFEYLVGSNLYALHVLMGQLNGCPVTDEDLGRLARGQRNDEGPWSVRRLQWLLDASPTSALDSAGVREWDIEPYRQEPGTLGPGWRFYGRRFLLSGIHTWADI